VKPLLSPVSPARTPSAFSATNIAPPQGFNATQKRLPT